MKKTTEEKEKIVIKIKKRSFSETVSPTSDEPVRPKLDGRYIVLQECPSRNEKDLISFSGFIG